MHPKSADGIANSTEPDQTAPSNLIWGVHCLLKVINQILSKY